jgi:DMSO/TMAO reductase YedYZ molybdopterin-dependent catalytic subunit
MMKPDEIIKSPDTLRKNRAPPNQNLTDQWPVLHFGSVPEPDTSRWRVRIFGLVKEPRELGFEEFTALDRVKVFSDIHCVTGWSRIDNLWEGVPAGAVRGIVEIGPAAKFVIIHGANNFTTNLALDDFFQPDVLFALTHNGKPITAEHGHPVRLIVPRLYFWKSAKWVDGLEFTAEDRPGFWETRGYHNHGDPWTEERYGE